MIRKQLLDRLSGQITAVQRSHPVRVAIDGVDAAGKTTLADELVHPLQEQGRTVIRASIDDFHNPREFRYRQGRHSPVGYFEDSFDYPALINHLLKPLGPNGNRLYRTTFFDINANAPVYVPLRSASDDAILLFDGIFLLRPILTDYWDLAIYVDVSFEETLARASGRDLAVFGTAESVQEQYRRRYIPGQQHYLDTCNPGHHADIVVDNEDPHNPNFIVHQDLTYHYPLTR